MLSSRSPVALALVLVLLASAASGQDAPPALRIAVLDAPGVGDEALATAVAAIDAAPGLRAQRVTPDEVRQGALEGAAGAVFTGGRGSVQGRMLGEGGRERVREFVRRGGGYVGICAGAYMALQGRAEFHKIAIVAGRHATGDAWVRGIAPLRVTPRGDTPQTFPLHYANGPLFAPEAIPGLPPFVTLATFDDEVSLASEGTHPGEMRGAPAIVASSLGRGRIVLFSPNPTLDPARPELLIAALRWASVARPVEESISWRDVFGAR